MKCILFFPFFFSSFQIFNFPLHVSNDLRVSLSLNIESCSSFVIVGILVFYFIFGGRLSQYCVTENRNVIQRIAEIRLYHLYFSRIIPGCFVLKRTRRFASFVSRYLSSDKWWKLRNSKAMEVSSVVITIDEMKIQRPKLLSRSAVQFDLNLIKRFRLSSVVSPTTRNSFGIVTDSDCDITVMLRSLEYSQCTS